MLFDGGVRVTGEPAVIRGTSIVGFGRQHLHYASDRELDWMEIGFSPRKADTSIYLSDGCAAHAEVLARLGKRTSSVACVYLKRLADVDPVVLEELVTRSVAHARSSNAWPDRRSGRRHHDASGTRAPRWRKDPARGGGVPRAQTAYQEPSRPASTPPASGPAIGTQL
ncbi:MAG: DUF1801 domain-containing protein [Cellulomonas sp.]|nr:DUF1801 domain-containing protein [Cellulomonas sp.]